jgi:hypothetical protein
MNQLAPIGHNNPPDPIDIIKADFADTLSEVENWLDGAEVQTEGQMKAVDALIKGVKEAEAAAKVAKEAEYRPHKEACDAVVSRWKPALDDLDRMKKGLLAAVDSFKRKLAAEKAEAERKARMEADRLRREAEEAARAASAADLEAQRKAAEKLAAAQEAMRAASDARKDNVKGLRTVTTATITDPRACINWIRENDREALVAFMDDYVARATRAGVCGIAGVEVTTTKHAF